MYSWLKKIEQIVGIAKIIDEQISSWDTEINLKKLNVLNILATLPLMKDQT